MLVLLNLQQMGLIFENYINKLHNTLLCLPLKKKAFSSREFQESLKKLYCAGHVIPCMNL